MSRDDFDAQLYEKLEVIWTEQQHAPESNMDTLRAFLKRLTDARDFAKQAVTQASLSTRTINLLRKVSYTNALAAKAMLKLGATRDTVGQAKDMDLECALANLSLNDPPTTEPVTPHKRKDSSDTSDEECAARLTTLGSKPVARTAPAASQMLEAREWAMEHLYSPYPSAKAKQGLAKRMGISEDNVGTWFTQLRRRIGWTLIVKKHFTGSKALAVDAARFVFFEGEAAEQRVGKAVCDKFIAMRRKAEDVLKLVSDAEVEERIDRLANEIWKNGPDRRDSSDPSTSDLKSNSTQRISGTEPHESASRKGTKRRSNEEDMSLVADRAKRCRRHRVEPYTTEVDEARSSKNSAKRKRDESEEIVPPETKKRNICDPSALLTSVPMIPATVADASLFDFDQTFPDTPALSPSSSYTGLDSCDWSTRSASPSTDHDYHRGLSGEGQPVAHETQLYLDSYLQPDARLSELSKLDRLWLDFTMPPPVITDALPEGELDFVFSNFRDDPLTINPALLSTNGMSSDAFGLSGFVNNPQSHDAASALLSDASLQLPADLLEAPDHPYIPTELADLLSSLNDTPNPATD